MTNEERDKAIRILQWLHDNKFLFRSTEEDVKYATKLAIQELEQQAEKINKIPKDYYYDTETDDFLVYRHRYNGDEIHIVKEPPLYRLEQQPQEGDKVSVEVLKQVMWERDIAIEQLKKLGYSLGEKIKPQERVIRMNKTKLVVELPQDWEKRIVNMTDSEIVDFLYGVLRNGVALKIEDIKTELQDMQKEYDILDSLPQSPCDLCRYNPPSSRDSKPCTMCPAERSE